MYGKILLLFLLAATNLLVWKDRKNIERSGLIFARRTKAGLAFLDRVAKAGPWKHVYTLAVAVCLVGIPYITILLAVNSLFILFTPTAPAGISPIIPGTELQGTGLVIPAVYGIIALFLLMVIHEFSHGIAARACGLKVESSGVLMALAIPGAFVEPNQKQFERSQKRARLRVAAAGSFANFMLALLCVLLIWAALSSYGQPKGGAVLIQAIPGTPAAGAFRQYDLIQEVNGQKVQNFTGIFAIVNGTAPNQTIDFKILRKDSPKDRDYTFGFDPIEEKKITLRTAARENSTSGYVGIPQNGLGKIRETPFSMFFLSFALNPISMVEFTTPQFWDFSGPWHLIYLLKWTAFLNFAVGLVNLLPLRGLDGGWIAEDAIKYASPKHGRSILTAVSYLIIFFLLLNLLPYFR